MTEWLSDFYVELNIRIGKTFLIREMFKDEFAFYTSGIIEGDSASQIDSFNMALKEYGYEGGRCSTWLDAFAGLKQILSKNDSRNRSVIFIDELPCLDTFDSSFLPALDWFWNTFGSARDDIMLIVCGSSTSWMLKNLLNNKKGLYNRLTRTIHLKPFKLHETELYAKANGAYWERIDILKMYCIIGGVPLYWSQLDYTKSVEENVYLLFFDESSILEGEYSKIMGSIFKNPGNYTKIIDTLCKKKSGMTRIEITDETGLSGGYLSELLDNLEGCDFIRGFNSRNKVKEKIWQVIDPFILFHHQFLHKEKNYDSHFWQKSINTPTTNTWYGFSFERICMLHVEQILYALHLDVVPTTWYSWRSKESDPKLQIDLVIERADNTITIAEIKFNALKEYTITKEEYTKIINRAGVFQEETKTKKGIQIIMITTFGVSKNSYLRCIQNSITIDDIFNAK